MPVVPHTFPTLRQLNEIVRPSTLTLGAGMSWGMIPGPDLLLAEKRVTAEHALGLATTPAANTLYLWADEIIAQLTTKGDPNPKLTLALSLGILSDIRWLGRTATVRSTPRHRVIARFAREGLWNQIWSLNWDCALEAAFENVGLDRKGPGVADAQLPWPNLFLSFVTASDCADMGDSRTVKIIKPHGCVKSLIQADEATKKHETRRAIDLASRFLITFTELNALANGPTDDFIFSVLCANWTIYPAVIAGWSVSEPYLITFMENRISRILQQENRGIDELSIIDIDFNNNGHARLAACYGRDKATTHVPVEKSGFTTDQLFLWIQALYGIQRLQKWAEGTDRDVIDQVLSDLNRPSFPPLFEIDWVDNFLPVWVRLCWRCELVECRTDRGIIPASEIDLESRDEHIPWHNLHIDRPDLRYAARILASLKRNGNASQYNFEIFPGGFLHGTKLVIPLPAWTTSPVNELRGLKPLVDAIKTGGSGKIDEVAVLLLTADPNTVPSDAVKLAMKEIVAKELSLVRFASGDKIGLVTLGDI